MRRPTATGLSTPVRELLTDMLNSDQSEQVYIAEALLTAANDADEQCTSEFLLACARELASAASKAALALQQHVQASVDGDDTDDVDDDSDDDAIAYINFYECPCCGATWYTAWSCQCNDRCPSCNKEIEPKDSIDWDISCAEDPGQILICLSLVDVETTLEYLQSLPRKALLQVSYWATMVHLVANDNDVVVPQIPLHVPFTETEKRLVAACDSGENLSPMRAWVVRCRHPTNHETGVLSRFNTIGAFALPPAFTQHDARRFAYMRHHSAIVAAVAAHGEDAWSVT